MPVWLSRFWLRLRSTLHPQHHQELSEELQLHLRLLEEEYVAQGLTPAEARDRARREFGNPTLLQEDSHDLFSFRAVENLAQDVRHAMGEMRRASSFIALAVALLALGIGAATAAFAIVDAVMFRPLPVRAPSGLVAVTSGDGAEWSRWPYAAFVRWRQGATGLAEIAASSDVDVGRCRRRPCRPLAGGPRKPGVGQLLSHSGRRCRSRPRPDGRRCVWRR